MGETNEIKDTNITLKLVGLDCYNCQQPFTQWDMKAENYDLWFDTTNDVGLKAMKYLEENDYYQPFGRTGYQLTIWIRSLEHKDCPPIEERNIKHYETH